MVTRELRPDALVIGAPKAGTSALHAALARHPQVYASPVKEPKHYLCTDAPPPAYVGPGDAHSQQEWVWRPADYAALFDAAPAGSVRLESTPFYLYARSARRRIAEELPNARLIVVVRDPVDRAYSNWTHLYVDGLEPEADFVAACRAEEERVDAGWAPFWHYRRMGRYGEQLADLFAHVERERVLVLRYRQLVDAPAETLNTVARFLGVEEGRVASVQPDNSRGFVRPRLRTEILARAVRLGAAAGAYAPPQVWRRASRPLIRALQAGGPDRRPRLTPAQRGELLDGCTDDIGLLEEVLGQSFDDWRSVEGRGSFTERTRV
ncbi:Sulfotransferase family protein [Microlunatus sagamiharensis]|uniref:Sulfotransferase family protein n=1 Tax=Microlunatus sagamiharensis TaxID=546874 RepID=A0A1H2NGI4_9ACTN|nr:sulfotransferase [Microlunatus sagamiharensis]SDV04484.1 Sulfotransferase family protein [Microlunatus sagamiharensis]